MYATVRSIKTNPGGQAEVAALIEAEYVPMMREVEGFISYTLVGIGTDEVTSVGVFTTAESAAAANEAAKTWSAERLMPIVSSPLAANAGPVLVRADA